MVEGGIMYYIYLIGHFVLALIWLISALFLDYIFLKKFNKVSMEEKKNLISRIRSLSDKTEMIASFFLPLLGVLMLIDREYWLTIGFMHFKITIALIAIGLFHASRGILRKIEVAIDSGDPIKKLYNKYIIFRTIVIAFLLCITSMILIFRGYISTIYLIRSWLI
tara:strand:+ start:25295 stop:25789 length:495 start_codon:yes stop_codon:yes gene_type:complete